MLALRFAHSNDSGVCREEVSCRQECSCGTRHTFHSSCRASACQCRSSGAAAVSGFVGQDHVGAVLLVPRLVLPSLASRWAVGQVDGAHPPPSTASQGEMSILSPPMTTKIHAVGELTWQRTSTSWIAAVGIVVVGTLVVLPTSREADPKEVAAQLLCCVGAGVAVLLPIVGGSLLGAVQLLLTLTVAKPYLGFTILAYPFVVALCAARGRRVTALSFGAFYLALFLWVAPRMQDARNDLLEIMGFWLVVVFAALLFGEIVWRLQLRSAQQREEQVMAAERERRAIARDLHDHLAYATTTMVMKADQARLRGGQDSQTLADLEYIAATGRSATADLRTMLALLRESGESKDGSPIEDMPSGLLPPTRLQEVIEAQRAKLAAFDFDVQLAISEDLATLPERQAAVLSRVLTEVASNVTKHGDPRSEVNIMIDISPDEVEAVLINKPRATPASTGHRGLGMLGLGEIVNAVGGMLTSGPVGDRWINHVTLPLDGVEVA